jgi:hypothetical protein
MLQEVRKVSARECKKSGRCQEAVRFPLFSGSECTDPVCTHAIKKKLQQFSRYTWMVHAIKKKLQYNTYSWMVHAIRKELQHIYLEGSCHQGEAAGMQLDGSCHQGEAAGMNIYLDGSCSRNAAEYASSLYSFCTAFWDSGFRVQAFFFLSCIPISGEGKCRVVHGAGSAKSDTSRSHPTQNNCTHADGSECKSGHFRLST